VEKFSTVAQPFTFFMFHGFPFLACVQKAKDGAEVEGRVRESE